MKEKFNKINLMYFPAITLLAVFVGYPFISGIHLSFTDWNGYSQSYNYIGFANYQKLISDKVIGLALGNTLMYGIGSTFLQQLLGLGYALLLNATFRARNLARTIIYMPVLVASVIMGYMWYFMLSYSSGGINEILTYLGLEKVDWLANPKISKIIIVLVNTLQYCGVSMIIYLAGLQGISESYYEAARIDGASKWDCFISITIPLLKPAIVTSITLNMIGGLKLFDVIKALTGGGPGYATQSLSTLIDSVYFRSQLAGYASTIGIFLFILILVVSLILMKLFNSKKVEY